MACKADIKFLEEKREEMEELDSSEENIKLHAMDVEEDSDNNDVEFNSLSQVA